jgi:hypothetical protein
MPGTVTIGCKIPQGIVLNIYEWETVSVPVMAGGFKEVKMSRGLPWRHVLNGPARKIGQDVPYQIIEGAALTHGVDADNFAIWMEQRKDTDMVRNGLVFAQIRLGDVIAQAKEHRGEKSGYEPIDPANLPPEFKRKIETAVTA